MQSIQCIVHTQDQIKNNVIYKSSPGYIKHMHKTHRVRVFLPPVGALVSCDSFSVFVEENASRQLHVCSLCLLAEGQCSFRYR